MAPYVEKGLSYYKLFKKMTAYSIFYHGLKKLALQIDYYSKMLLFRKINKSQMECRETTPNCGPN